ncbi:MAG: hypothetical protein ILA34_01825 [Bacteroidaceae bacterium]|nr:hypothetical protein [Bacteroidaceae bacterium]
MKRIAYLFTLTCLSLMLIFSGAGVALVDCCHDHNLFVAQLDFHNHHAHKNHHHICQGKDHCMKVRVVRLSPSVQVRPAMDFSAPVTALMPSLVVSEKLCFGIRGNACGQTILFPHALHCPPRLLLRLIRILII